MYWVQTGAIKKRTTSFERNTRALIKQSSSVSAIALSIPYGFPKRDEINRAIKGAASEIWRESENISALDEALEKIAQEYERCENTVLGKEEREDANKTSTKWNLIVKIGSEAGIVGSVGKTIYDITTGDDPIKTGLTVAKDVTKVSRKVISAVDAGSKWQQYLFGTYAKERVTLIDQIKKLFPGKDAKFVDKAKARTRWAGHLLTFALNGYENYQEHGGFTGRMIGETLIETGVDIGLGMAATALIGGPAVLVGGVTTLAIAGANAACKWITKNKDGNERDLGEVLSDFVYDDLPKIVNDVGKGAVKVVKTIGDTAAGAVNAVRSAIGNIGTRWKTAFGW